MTKAKAQNSGQNLDELGGGYTGSSLRFFTFIFFSFLLGTRVAKPKKFFKNMQLKKIASHSQDISCFKVKVLLHMGILSLSLSLPKEKRAISGL